MSIALRSDLVGLKPYQSFDARVKARLNTNENPYCVPSNVAQDIACAVEQAVLGANRYPSDEFLELREAFVQHIFTTDGIRLSPEQILAANGSNELMDEIFDAFGGPSLGADGLPDGKNSRVALTFSPSYSMYPQYARDSFTRLLQIPREPSEFHIDLEAAKQAISEHRPSLVVIANPNNPTGTLTPQADIRALLEHTQSITAAGSEEIARAQGQNARPVVCIDEAYIDFKDEDAPSSLPLVEEFSNLLVVRTLSKAFSFAGVRVGYAAASSEIIDALKVVRLPYNLSSVTQTLAKVALEHRAQMLQAVDEIRAERNALYTWLKTLEYKGVPLHIVHSAANFIQLGVKDVADFPRLAHDFLIERGVQIRVVGPSGYFRVTIGTPEENALFKQEFAAFLSQKDGV